MLIFASEKKSEFEPEAQNSNFEFRNSKKTVKILRKNNKNFNFKIRILWKNS